MGAIGRLLGDNYPVGQLVFFRASFALVPIAGLMLVSGIRLADLKTERPLFNPAVS